MSKLLSRSSAAESTKTMMYGVLLDVRQWPFISTVSASCEPMCRSISAYLKLGLVTGG